jgi:hypothetical protein
VRAACRQVLDVVAALDQAPPPPSRGLKPLELGELVQRVDAVAV